MTVEPPDERSRRVSHNEALFRLVNEQIESVNEAFSKTTSVFTIVCECGDLTCMEQVTVSHAVYEKTRDDSTHFIIKPGHQVADVEDVIETCDEFAIVEKTPAAARQVAEETDPRT